MCRVPSTEAIADIVTIAWTLEKLSRRQGVPAAFQGQLRYLGRRLNTVAIELGGEAIDVTGRTYESGLAIEVLESSAGGSSPPVIAEMATPIVKVDGRVVRYGQVIVAGQQVDEER